MDWDSSEKEHSCRVCHHRRPHNCRLSHCWLRGLTCLLWWHPQSGHQFSHGCSWTWVGGGLTGPSSHLPTVPSPAGSHTGRSGYWWASPLEEGSGVRSGSWSWVLQKPASRQRGRSRGSEVVARSTHCSHPTCSMLEPPDGGLGIYSHPTFHFSPNPALPEALLWDRTCLGVWQPEEKRGLRISMMWKRPA